MAGTLKRDATGRNVKKRTPRWGGEKSPAKPPHAHPRKLAGSVAPLDGKCGAALHKQTLPDGSVVTRYCAMNPCVGRKRCRMHGGTQPVGVASVHYKHGKDSRYALLPEGVAARFRRATEDPDWLSTHAEIALLLARMDRAATEGKWPRWDTLSTQLRLMMDSEMKRREQAQQMLSVDRVLIIVDRLVDAVRKHVHDRATFAAIYQEVQATLSARPETTRTPTSVVHALSGAEVS